MDERISIAPMMEWTDPHYRVLMRGLTKKSVLYTEMVVDDTVIHGPGLDFFVGRYIEEQPSVIQLGGHEPEKLAHAAEICEQYGGQYSEINLNCGCPSPRVAKRCFGAKLMLEPDHLREIVYTMQRRVSIPVTVKCRIGADDMDTYEDLTRFIRAASSGGPKKFIIHARKCMLNGISPKQNREIPPLRYEVVHRLVRDFPELTFIMNGGINTFQQAKTHVDVDNKYTFFTSTPSETEPEYETLPAVDGVMIGRAAFNNPAMFATADSEFYGVKDPCLTRRQILERYIDYCDWCQSEDGPNYTLRGKTTVVTTSVLLNAMRNIMHGLPNVQRFRTALNDVYMEKLRGMNGSPNPPVRDVIEGALLVMDDCDIDRPLGNPYAGEDVVKPCHNFGTRTTAVKDYSTFVGVLKDGPVGRINTGHSPRAGRKHSGSSTASNAATTPTDAASVGSAKTAAELTAASTGSSTGESEQVTSAAAGAISATTSADAPAVEVAAT